ncbi:sugar phosphate isomerase/epimerase [Rhodococcus sp. X156]|uniref:sugar phosphate isomerase/epimerase family protein n=1 Tax=Rhodococcus sp. X156 TaxID=2499145 RepID=UPI000FD9F6F3|nr:sugar phosphate isomerase/epimerase [Rhodococcus sp. X156]
MTSESSWSAPQRPIPIALSTASVYPESVESGFELAADLGYDGVELMVWTDPVSQDPAAVGRLIRRYGVPVLAVHAPCLLITQRVWGSDPVARLDRAVDTAAVLGASTVVVHPPFRWQRRYADGFADQVAELEERSDLVVAVENMFPLRTDRFFGAGASGAERLARRGGGPGPSISAFSPSIDPTEVGYPHYTLDLSHTATAGTDAVAMATRMGSRLAHLHLADGDGAAVDQHLVPGYGSQPCAHVCETLAATGFDGVAVLEINSQSARTRRDRAAMLAEALAFARRHLKR